MVLKQVYKAGINTLYFTIMRKIRAMKLNLASLNLVFLICYDLKDLQFYIC